MMLRGTDANTELVDCLIEDRTEVSSLRAKPICFMITGKPGVGKSTLAKKIADSWGCILVDDTDLINTHIKNETKEGLEILEVLSEGKTIPEDMVVRLIQDRLEQPEIEHYGYVISCLPFIPEDGLQINEQIQLVKDLKLTPDFIINIKCVDKDLIQRLSGQKQHPGTGQLFNKEKWKDGNMDNSKKKKGNKDEDASEGKDKEEQLVKYTVDQMVWKPENLAENAAFRIATYKEAVLRTLEEYIMEYNPLYVLELDGNNRPEDMLSTVMYRLGSMAIQRVPIPVLLNQTSDEEMPEDLETDELLRIMSSTNTVIPGHRWRRSRWAGNCPVALKEGKVVAGKPELSVGFQDKVYILSSVEAYQKFVTNPRRYLLPPMPRPPCKVSIIGPTKAGKSTLCKLLAEHYSAVVLDVQELALEQQDQVRQEKLDKIAEETTKTAIAKVKSKQDGGQGGVTENHPEVQAMVLAALDEAKNISPFEIYAEILKRRMNEMEEADADAELKTGWVLDNFPTNLHQMEALKQAEIVPDSIFCLKDTDAQQIIKRKFAVNPEVEQEKEEKVESEEVEEKEKEEIQNEGAEEEEVKDDEEEEKEKEKKDDKEEKDKGEEDTLAEQSPLESQEPEAMSEDPPSVEEPVTEGSEENSLPEISQAGSTTQSDTSQEKVDSQDLTYPSPADLQEFTKQMQAFLSEWEQLHPTLSGVSNLVLEIGTRTPEDLLQEIIKHMEKPFKYKAWEVTTVDINEEAEDREALVAQDKAEERMKEEPADEVKQKEKKKVKRLLGDTHHFCPVALRNNNVLVPCTETIAAKYRERTYYFSSAEAKDAFIECPEEYVAKTGPLKPPALRIFVLGARASGKTTQGEWLARQLGLFHVQFREQLQLPIIAKTKKRVPRSDEVDPSGDPSEDLENLKKEAMVKTDDDDEGEEVELNEEETSIKGYLSDGDPLSTEILDKVVARYWKEEPFMDTGFILEGFPHTADDVQYMLDQQLLPDVVVTTEVEAIHVQTRLLPAYYEKWRERCSSRKLLSELRTKIREKNIVRRRAELRASKAKPKDQEEKEYDEEDDDDNMEDEIEAVLEEEFPPEEDEYDKENEETAEMAVVRLAQEIEDRYRTDKHNLATVVDLLMEQNIPYVTINAARKLVIVRHQLLRKIQPLLTNRESLFQRCQPISHIMVQKLLFYSFKSYSSFGCLDPIKLYKGDLMQPLQWPLGTTHPLLFHQYIYLFTSKENLDTFMMNPLAYIRQPKPSPPPPLKMAIIGPPKSGKTTVARMFAHKYGVARLSMGDVIRIVLNTQGESDLSMQMKKYLTLGRVVPDELAIQCLDVVLMTTVCSTHGYVLDGFPMTRKHAELMASRSIIPMIVVELQLETVEVLKRGLSQKMKPNKPHLKNDSSEVLHNYNSCYRQEVEDCRQYFQLQYRNWVVLDGLKSKWSIYDSIIKEAGVSMKYIQNFLERTSKGQAACISRMCVTPQEMEARIGEFEHYCPVCLAKHYHLVDCSEIASYAAEFRSHYYKMCNYEHLEKFLTSPTEYVLPRCPHKLPDHGLLPKKLNDTELKWRFPEQVQMKGFCPVTYLDGNQRYEALVRGRIDFIVEYKERIYIFETQKKMDKFLRMPETYWNQTLPNKVPPFCEPLSLTSLPTLGFLEQGVAEAVIKAMRSVGCLMPKYPYISIERSALLYVAYYLKAFNQKSTESHRLKYKKKLDLFEENCNLIPFLSSSMRAMKDAYRPPSERPADFEVKLKRFLSLGANGSAGILPNF